MSIKDTLQSKKVFLQYGGQGSPYLKELVSLFQKPELKRYFDTAFCAFEEEMKRPEVSTSIGYPLGLDVRLWVTNPDSAPDESYLSAASVSIPLIGMTQLANFFWLVEAGIAPDLLIQGTAGVTGHSQGLIPAVMTGLGYSGDELYHHCGQYLKYLLYLGLSSQEAYGSLEVPADAIAKMQELGEKDISPMVAILGPDAAQLEKLVAECNGQKAEEDKIYVSLYNTPNSNVISAKPMSLLLFRQQYKDMMDENKWKFVPIKTTAPFHSPLMNKSKLRMQQEIDRMKFSYQGSQLKVPVYSIHDGRNLQQDKELAMVMFSEMVLEVLHWDKATAILRIDKNISQVIDFGPSKVSSRLTGAHLEGVSDAPEILSLSNAKDLKNIF